MHTEFLYNKKEDVTKVYLWDKMTLLDKEIYDGKVETDERDNISNKLIQRWKENQGKNSSNL